MATASTDDPRHIAELNLEGTLCEAFQATAAARTDEPALRFADGGVAFTFGQYAERMRDIAGGLAALGIEEGDTVAVMLTNRIEFHLVDLASIHLGAIPFSVYNTNPPAQIVPLVDNSEARVCITEQAFLPAVLAAQELRPQLEHVVVVDGDGSDRVLTLDELARKGDPSFPFEETWRSLTRDHVITLVYTSGTTGEPKGVQHTHDSILFGEQCFDRLFPTTPGGRVCSYLPMAHVAERFISHYPQMIFGHCVTCVPNPKELSSALGITRPTRLFGVPRIYEKLHAAVLAMAAEDRALAAAIAAGVERVRARERGESAPAADAEQEALYARIRERLGLDQIEWIGVAAAPSPRAVLEFFPAIGLNLVEFWGMSECTFSTANPPDAPRIGTIGRNVPGVEVKLADDGEILVRGRNVMTGYRREPEKTREAIDEDGWLHTGDVARADEDGYLTIIDRKKELIINSAGKNMSPTKIELSVKESSPLVGEVVAIGDGRTYVTALVVLDEDAARAWAAEQGVAAEATTLARDERIRAEIAAAVEKANQKLARVEQIKAHTIVPEFWAPGSPELTPTLKLKRRVVDARWAAEIDSLYASPQAAS
jgi:long-chain acyl-CoA synthetase